MGLQVRLVHSLGDRLIDLPEKSIDAPVVVGRSAEADVQVPSVTISRRQCLLFLVDGQWMLQDATGGRTFLNGQPVVGAAFLHSHDIVTLGNDPTPPRLVIDPFGLDVRGQSGSVENESEPAGQGIAYEASRPPGPHGGYSAPTTTVPSVPQPRAHPNRMMAPPPSGGGARYLPPEEPIIVADDEPDETPVESMVLNSPELAAAPPIGDPSSDWMTQPTGAADAQQRFYVPRQNGWPAGMIAMGAAVAIVMLGVAAYIYHLKEPQVAQTPQSPADQGARQKLPPRISPGYGGDPNRSPGGSSSLPSVNPHPRAAAMADAVLPEDPRRKDPDWARLDDVHRNHDPVMAIVIFDDYARMTPETPYAADLRKYTDDALDRIWWMHIVDLATQRDVLIDEIAKKARDLAQSSDPEFKKTLQADKTADDEKLAKVMAELQAMKYLSTEKPNLYDSNQMMELRRARDPRVYDPWKARAEERIKNTRGTRSVW